MNTEDGDRVKEKCKPILRFLSPRGQIRVGRIDYSGGKPKNPSFENFTPIIVLTKSSPYGSIGPYALKDKHGRIMENIWQFSKVYVSVPQTHEKFSRWDNTVIWQHPAERHINEDGSLTKEYWRWRQKGFKCQYAVRYPVGMKHRKTCQYLLKDNSDEKLTYIEARKRLYLPVYVHLARQQPQYYELLQRLSQGENLLIIEVDGPHEECLPYYKKYYKVGDDFIVNSTISVTKENMEIMMNDTSYPFGHGYCLAMALLGLV